MGNQIDCKYVCQEPQIQQDHFFVHSNSGTRKSLLKTIQQTPRDNKPTASFAKPVNQVLTMNKKVSQVYLTESFKINQDYIHSISQGTKLGPYYIYSLFAYFQGQWLDGNINGNGTLFFDNGSLLQATFSLGLVNCPNTLFIFPNGSFYKGKVQNQKPNGYGIFKSKDFNYKGQWKINKIKRQHEQAQRILFNRNHNRFVQKEQLFASKQQTIQQQGIIAVSQVNYHACTSKQKPSNIRTTKTVLKINNHAVTPTSGCFPQKHHFRKVSCEFKQDKTNFKKSAISQLGSSVLIQKLRSQFSNQKTGIKIVHKRGKSNCSNKV